MKEYAFDLTAYADIPEIAPFCGWTPSNPTASLGWYDAYNKTKHDRDAHFSEATLLHCIEAVVANLVLHCVKFGPFQMIEQNNAFSALVNQHFEGRLIAGAFDTYYLPTIILPPNRRLDLFTFDPRAVGYTQPYSVLPLTL